MARFGCAVLAALLAQLFLAWDAGAVDKRPQQDYGAPDNGTSSEEVLLWGPRVVFFPLWLTSEFVLRRPIAAAVKAAEKDELPRKVIRLFTFGDRDQITFFPSALFDFGLLPSVGFNATWKYFGTDPNTLRLHFGTWGPEWIQARVVDTYALTKGEDVSIDGRFVRRQDNPFFGLGPHSRQDARSRYDSQLAELGVGYEHRPWKSSAFSAQLGLRSLSLKDVGTCCGNPTVQDSVARGTFPAPPGLGHSYFGGFQQMSIAVDSREPRPQSGSGVLFELYEASMFAPSTSTAERAAWARYGAQAGAFVDLTGRQRVMSLEASVEMADPLLGKIPFPEQATLGGDRPMRGYLRDRLIDRSAFSVGVHYTWPVWVYLDGVIEVDMGNVFGPQLSGFDPKVFRLSSGIGVRSNGDRDSGFELLVAGATDPFDTGFNVSSFRFLVGSHHGF